MIQYPIILSHGYTHCNITGVYLSLYGRFLRNDSTIAYTEINSEVMEGADSLACNTDNSECCETEGNWYFNGSAITEGSQEFTVIRNIGKIMVFRNNRIISATSTLCCRTPNANNINQTVCVNSGQLEYYK